MTKIKTPVPKQALLILMIVYLISFILVQGLQASPFVCMQVINDAQVTAREITEPVELPVVTAYVEPTESVLAQNLMFFTSTQYSAAVLNNSIPMNAILVLDHLPLKSELPLVAAVIVSEAFSLEDTHTQLLAQKTGIPLIHIAGAFNNFDLRQLSIENPGFELTCKENHCTIAGTLRKALIKPKIESVLPKSYNRDLKTVYSHHNDLKNFRPPRELAGDKYFELMGFKHSFPDLVPNITAVSSGYFEDFLNHYKTSDHISLKRRFFQIEKEIGQANIAHDEPLLKKILSDYQHEILNAKPDRAFSDIFTRISIDLKDHYITARHPKAGAFSIRSNQEVEDLIGAGLYESTVTPSLESKDLEENIRKNWASLWDYRAYTFRRFWGQREYNLSTALMVHPYIQNINAHSVGSFTFNPKTDLLELDINMVLGENERATNPSDTAKKLQFKIVENSHGGVKLKLRPTDEHFNFIMEQINSEDFYQPLITFFNEVRGYVKDEFRLRKHTPTAIDIEFVLERPSAPENKVKVLVLQYKPKHTKDIIIDLLIGIMDRSDTDKKMDKTKLTDAAAIARENDIKTLNQTTQKLYSDVLTNKKPPTSFRYALMVENKQPYFIFWDASVYHISMKEKFADSQAKWLKSGYLKLENTGPQKQMTLTFTETTYETTDETLRPATSQLLFQQAFNASLTQEPDVHVFLTLHQPVVFYQTFEAYGTLQIPPLPSKKAP